MENPYWLALADPELGYLTRIAVFTALFAGLSKAVEWVVASARPEGGVSSALAALSDPSMEGKARSGAQAASTVLSMVHALGTSAASIWTVQALLRGGAAADPEAVARLWSLDDVGSPSHRGAVSGLHADGLRGLYSGCVAFSHWLLVRNLNGLSEHSLVPAQMASATQHL
ncbi:unnamed protein product, partial [Polarella glacialis]